MFWSFSPLRQPAIHSRSHRLAPSVPTLLSTLTVAMMVLGALPASSQLVIGHEIGAGEGVRAQTLSPNSEYDTAVPAPHDSLGFEVGAFHVRPEQMLPYFERLAAASDRVELRIQGHTHERRPQPLLVITSPENHQRLDEIRERHHELVRGERDPTDQDPVVVLLGFSIHGNEPSGANASLLVAHHLAAEVSGEVEEWLRRAVILLDPSFNPDGLARFANWVNTNRGAVANTDPQSREHREEWPYGRTNHYYFDLNRDWLLAQQPESRNRLATFHRWRPNLLTDHHEMGSNSTFFFQPGVPERTNPLIPESNVELTHQLAEFHATALDAAGRLYYSEEGFDDFYPGKGSTYPDLQGSVGILFEQASAEGHALETNNGELTFAFGIGNQYYAALSSVRGAVGLRTQFLQHQVDFARAAGRAAQTAAESGYLVHVDGDVGRLHHLLDFFQQHHVESHVLQEDHDADGSTFRAGESLFVPIEQPQSVLVRSLFEPLTEFRDDIFYDVSTWSLPLAFGATTRALSRTEALPRFEAASNDASEKLAVRSPSPASDEATLAWAFEWHGYYAPRALAAALSAGARARVAVEELELHTDQGQRRFARGTVVLPTSLAGDADLEQWAREASSNHGVEVFRVRRGLAASGVDLGSPSLRPIELPKVAILTGSGVGSYAVGEVWHLLDYRFQVVTTLLDADALGRADLDRYSHLVLPNGFYSFSESATESLRSWVGRGGTLVGLQNGARFVERQFGGDEENGEAEQKTTFDDEEPRVFADYRRERAAELIGGTILAAQFDLTHPLAYGYHHEEIPLFRSDADLLQLPQNPYETVARYVDPPRVSGYISETNQERLAGTPAVVAKRMGRGTIILMADNPNFRSFWFGTSKLFLNALFLSDLISQTSAPSTWHH